MKKIFLALLFCLFVFPANAKVTLYDIPLKQIQIDVVKGHLYIFSQQPAGAKNKVLFAKSAHWLEDLHKSKKVHEISKIKRKESDVIRASIFFIAKVERGEYSPKLTKREVNIWYTIGRNITSIKKKKTWEFKKIK